MVEYRRGVVSERKNELWHWHPNCPSYPEKSYSIKNEKPFEEHLCSKCASLTNGS